MNISSVIKQKEDIHGARDVTRLEPSAADTWRVHVDPRSLLLEESAQTRSSCE